MKRLLAILVVLTLALACAPISFAEAVPGDSNGDGIIRVGWAANNMDETKALYLKYYQEFFASHPESDFVYTSAEGLAEKQVGDVDSLIALGCDVIWISVIDPTAAYSCVDACHNANVRIITYGDKLKHPDVDLEVGNRPYDYGVVQGSIISKWLDANPDINLKVGYIRGDLASQQVADTYQGLIDTIAEYIESGRFEIIVDDTATWRSADAMLKTEDWLQAYPELNSIVCQNDEMAIGAIQAINAAGLKPNKDVFVFGKDGNAHGREYILSGEMTATVFIDHRASCFYFVDIINRFAHGEQFPQKTIIPDFTMFLAELTPESYDEVMAWSEAKYAEVTGG